MSDQQQTGELVALRDRLTEASIILGSIEREAAAAGAPDIAAIIHDAWRYVRDAYDEAAQMPMSVPVGEPEGSGGAGRVR